jgi:hypothetical protein
MKTRRASCNSVGDWHSTVRGHQVLPQSQRQIRREALETRLHEERLE